MIFDAAVTLNDVSLKTALLKEPQQAQPLVLIPLQFRKGKVGVAAGIREMFSQIKIRQIDQHAQRYFGRNGDRSTPTEE